MKNSLFCSVALLVLVVGSLVFSADIITVTVKGMSDIVAGRKDIAREKALEDAFRRAVEQAVGTLISAEALVQNGQLVSDRIYKQATGYVKSYEIVNETVDEKWQLYWITIRAQVLKIDLEKSIKELITYMGTTRVLFALDAEPQLVSALKNDMHKNGIQVVDPDQLKDILDRQKAALAKQGFQEAIDSGLWFWARYVLKGKTEAKKEEDLKVGNLSLKVVSYKYLIELIDVTNAVIVMSEGRTVINHGGNHEVALLKCVEEAIDNLLGKIPRRIIEYQTSKTVVILIAKNAPKIREQLPTIPGVSGLEQTEKFGDEERYQFQYTGDLNVLEKCIAEFGYLVTRTGNTIFVLPKLRKVTIQIENASTVDVWKVRNELKAEEVTFTKGIVRCSLIGDLFEIAEKLERMGYEITELTENSITCQPKQAK